MLAATEPFPPGSAADRRRESRRPHRAVVIMPYGEGIDAHFELAELTDVSPGGVGLVSARPIKAGNPFFLRLELGRTVLVVYRVCHCQPTSNTFHIGARFTGLVGGNDTFQPTRAEVYSALSALH